MYTFSEFMDLYMLSEFSYIEIPPIKAGFSKEYCNFKDKLINNFQFAENNIRKNIHDEEEKAFGHL